MSGRTPQRMHGAREQGTEPSAGIRHITPRRAGFVDVELSPGDVLLSLGAGEVSKAIRTLDGGKYSHAAIWSGENVVESTTPSVVEHSLDQSLSQHERVYVDVYRLRRAGDERRNIVVEARKYLGRAYAYGDLSLLAVTLAFTTWIPERRSQIAFLLNTCKLTQFFNLDRETPGRLVTCTGLVARACVNADIAVRVPVLAPGRLDPALVGAGAMELVRDAKRGDGENLESDFRVLQARARQAVVEITGAPFPVSQGEARDPLRRARTRVLARIGDEWNPSLVTPRQLEKSPDLKYCGRLYAGERPARRSPSW